MVLCLTLVRESENRIYRLFGSLSYLGFGAESSSQKNPYRTAEAHRSTPGIAFPRTTAHSEFDAPRSGSESVEVTVLSSNTLFRLMLCDVASRTLKHVP